MFASFQIYRAWAPVVSIRDLEALPWRQEHIRMFGKMIPMPRLTCWMGSKQYKYSGVTNEPAQIPSWIAAIQAQAESLTGARFNSVLANYYRGGSDSVSWHADDEPELGQEPVIASVSYGDTREFRIRATDRTEQHNTFLHNRDLVVMCGDSQQNYQHCVPKTTLACGPRWNLTFRAIL